MRVGIDYQFARTHAPGVGRYAREMTRAMVRLEGCPELRLLEFGREPAVMSEESLGLGEASGVVVRRRFGLPRRLLGGMHRLGLGADRLLGGVDLFQHVRLPCAPVSKAKQVLTVSDLPVPGSPALAEVARRLAPIDHLLVFSRHYQCRLTDELGRDPSRVHYVPVGADHWVRDLPEQTEPVEPPRILVLGAPRAPRRHLKVLRACEQLVARGVDLTLHVGGRRGPDERDFDDALQRSRIADKVTWRAPSEVDLPALVAQSALLVHFNEDEGTAVTPLEAFAVGTAVLASRLPAFEEALDGKARLIDNALADDTHRLADEIAAALQNDRGIDASRGRREVAAAYTWESNARATLDLWRGF